MEIQRSSRSDPRLAGRDLSWAWRWLLPGAASGQPEEGKDVWFLLCLALLFLLPLGWLFVLWGIGAAMTAGTGGNRIGVGYAVFFAVITWAPLALSFAAWKRSDGIIRRLASACLIVLFALLSLLSTRQLFHEIVR